MIDLGRDRKIFRLGRVVAKEAIVYLVDCNCQPRQSDVK